MPIHKNDDLPRSFVAVAELENFNRAAAALGCKQPSISRRLKNLEEMAGTELFKRGARA
ncbi:LysR family transcriptional regulator [Mesorhizobium sp. M1374]